MNKKAGAPKGNKNAVGHGRPPNPGFSDDDLLLLGEELIKFLDDDLGCNIIHLSQWYNKIKRIPRSQWDSICRRDCFIVYYELAIERVGLNILFNKELSTAYGSRFLSMCFAGVKEHELDIMKKKVDYEIAKKQEAETIRTVPPNDQSITVTLGLIKENQELKNRLEEVEKVYKNVALSYPVAHTLVATNE